MQVDLPYSFIIYEQTNPPLDDVRTIFAECQWGNVSDQQFQKLFANSFLTIIGYAEQKPISFMRVVSDQVIYALIVDVMVCPEYRKQGIAENMLQNALRVLKDNKIFVVKLLSTELSKPLYQKLGFKICDDASPGMFLYGKDISC